VKLDRKEDNGEQSGTRHEGIVHSDQSTDEARTTAVILKLVTCLLLEGLWLSSLAALELLLRVL
jgi:hypothetical protein